MISSEQYSLLYPRSVAVIGASRNPEKRGFRAIKRLVEDGFEGEIYPINPEAADIAGVRCYKSIEEVSGPIDLALIVRPARDVEEALHACGRAGVRGAVVLAVGFRESGEAGRALEDAIIRTAREHGIQLVGPNTSGLFNTHARLNIVGLEGVQSGDVSVLSQSGNVILGLVNDARLAGSTGFASYVGLGNESGVGFHDCLAALREDPHTEAVIVYAEGFREGRSFLEELRATVAEKPVVLLKAGRSDAGTRSAASHTGALAGSYEVADGALRQAGAVVVDRLDELLPVTTTLRSSPPMNGDRVAIIADGGGHATMAADALVSRGMEVPTLSADTQTMLRELLGEAAAVSNPVDVAGGADGDPRLFASVVEAVLADPNVDGADLVGLFGGYGARFSESLAPLEIEAAEALVDVVGRQHKPLVVQSVYAGLQPKPLLVLAAGGVSVHQSVDIAARCVKALRQRGTFLATSSERSDFSVPQPSTPPILDGGMGMLPEHDARQLLQGYGVHVAPWMLASDPDQAEAATREFDVPVAVKVVSRDVVHKSDAGGVHLDVVPGEAGLVFDSIRASLADYDPSARMEGVLVSPMAERGLEIIIGVIRDDTFGATLMLGLGGTMVDVIGGTAFRTLPLTRWEAEEMTHEFRSGYAFDGYRGIIPDRQATVDMILSVSNLICHEPSISELDLNPVVVSEAGAVAVDVRVVLRPLAGA